MHECVCVVCNLSAIKDSNKGEKCGYTLVLNTSKKISIFPCRPTMLQNEFAGLTTSSQSFKTEAFEKSTNFHIHIHSYRCEMLHTILSENIIPTCSCWFSHDIKWGECFGEIIESSFILLTGILTSYHCHWVFLPSLEVIFIVKIQILMKNNCFDLYVISRIWFTI